MVSLREYQITLQRDFKNTRLYLKSDLTKPLERLIIFKEDSPEEVLEKAKKAEPAIAKSEGNL